MSTVNLEDLAHLLDKPKTPWWNNVAVMPRQEDMEEGVDPAGLRFGFIYTSGLSEECEVWCPVMSIEDRYGGPEFMSVILNHLAIGLMAGLVEPGDDVVLYEEPGSSELNAVFWVGELEPNDGSREVNISQADTVVPVLWSSRFGFKELLP